MNYLAIQPTLFAYLVEKRQTEARKSSGKQGEEDIDLVLPKKTWDN